MRTIETYPSDPFAFAAGIVNSHQKDMFIFTSLNSSIDFFDFHINLLRKMWSKLLSQFVCERFSSQSFTWESVHMQSHAPAVSVLGTSVSRFPYGFYIVCMDNVGSRAGTVWLLYPPVTIR